MNSKGCTQVSSPKGKNLCLSIEASFCFSQAGLLAYLTQHAFPPRLTAGQWLVVLRSFTQK